MNEHGFSQVVGYLIWNEEQWSFYCTGCAREDNVHSGHAVCMGDKIDVHRVPRCISCEKDISGLSFITPIEVRIHSKAKQDSSTVAASMATKDSFPSGTEWDEELEGFVAKFAPEQVDELISYIAESRSGGLYIQFGVPVIEIPPSAKQQSNKSKAKNKKPKRSGKSGNGQTEVIDLSIIQVIKGKQVKADWQQLNCVRNDKLQCHAVSFASTLELLTYLEDHGGTLTLAELPHRQAIVPTITLSGKKNIASSAA